MSSPNVARRAYLTGGLSAIHNPGMDRAEIGTGIGAPSIATVSVPSFAAFIHALEANGLTIVGVEFYQSELELQNALPAQWRMFASGAGWVVHDAILEWRERSRGGYDKGDRLFVDLAARLAFSMAAVQERIRQTAAAYANQLRGLQLRNQLQSRVAFDDLHSLPVALAIHAAFYELGSLRDIVAQFLAQYVFGLKAGQQSWDMSALVKIIRTTKFDDELAKELALAARSKPSPGWLAEMSEYRNLFMHVAPIQFTRRSPWAIQESHTFRNIGALPVLYHPLPTAPAALKHARATVSRQSTGPNWLDSAREGPSPDSLEPDALEYLTRTSLRLCNLAHRAAARAPHGRAVVELTDADVLGAVTAV